ncbi:MAG: hypothetical protein ABIN99_01550 [Nitrosospira sp.]
MGQQANQFTLKGYHIEIEYTIGATPGIPVLHYKDASVSLNFTQADIRTDQTALGSLVSIRLKSFIDTGGTIFAFFLPNIDVPNGQTADFTTVAIREDPILSRIGPQPGNPS